MTKKLTKKAVFCHILCSHHAQWRPGTAFSIRY